MTERKLRQCKCGHSRGHPLVEEEPEYTLWGWIVLSMFGITPKPDHIAYRCQICRMTVATSRNPALLARRSKPVEADAVRAANASKQDDAKDKSTT